MRVQAGSEDRVTMAKEYNWTTSRKHRAKVKAIKDQQEAEHEFRVRSLRAFEPVPDILCGYCGAPTPYNPQYRCRNRAACEFRQAVRT